MRFSSSRCLLLRCSWTEEGPQGVVTLGAFGFCGYVARAAVSALIAAQVA